MKLDLTDPRVTAALALVGVPYVYGAGRPSDVLRDDVASLAVGVSTKQSGDVCGWDCFGACQAYAVVVGDLDPRQPDRSAHGGAMEALNPVAFEDARPGDIVLYDRNDDARIEHADIYLGNGLVLSMSGGSPTTHGQNPLACGKVLPLGPHKTLARWKPAVRPR